MNEQPKSKVLIIIIGILLIANIVMLAFFMLNNKHKNVTKERRAYVIEYLEKEVGFTSEQMARYDSLSKHHREQVKLAFKDLSAERKNILKNLAGASFSDSAINSAANGIYERQKLFEFNMLRHLKDIRAICTDAQRLRFDTGFYKIFGRRGETHKEK